MADHLVRGRVALRHRARSLAGTLILAGVAAAAPAVAQESTPEPIRDPIGDLNAGQVQAGAFPGAILIPNTGDVSFGVFGMVKALGIYDTHAEGRRAVLLPAFLGEVGRDDLDGGSTLTAELSRVGFDGRAPLANGRVRGHIEFDFARNAFNWRLGFFTWSGPWGELTAGKNWSTFMDMQTIAEGLGEPTVSGVIFTRQAMFRYSRMLTPRVRIAAAVEDPESNDVLAPAPVLTRTGWPDIIGTISHTTPKAHVQVGGLVRSLEFDPNDAPGASDVGWGVQVTGRVVAGRERITGGFVTGEGLGRYLLGLTANAGAFVSIDPPLLVARQNQGGFLTIRHPWSEECRSTGAWGMASTETIDLQGPSALANSSFGLANFLCRANRFTTIGVEYNYGRRENRDGSVRDTHRVMFGMQLF